MFPNQASSQEWSQSIFSVVSDVECAPHAPQRLSGPPGAIVLCSSPFFQPYRSLFEHDIHTSFPSVSGIRLKDLTSYKLVNSPPGELMNVTTSMRYNLSFNSFLQFFKLRDLCRCPIDSIRMRCKLKIWYISSKILDRRQLKYLRKILARSSCSLSVRWKLFWSNIL